MIEIKVKIFNSNLRRIVKNGIDYQRLIYILPNLTIHLLENFKIFSTASSVVKGRKTLSTVVLIHMHEYIPTL